MPVRPSSSYCGQIDWNSVYRAYYPMHKIETRVENLLPGPSEILYCGFAEIACRLSARHSVHYIEFSESMAEAAHREFPTITKTSQVDILDTIEFDATPVVLVVCRISAYWRSPDCLQRFLSGVRKSPRDVVAVDFFDADRLESGESLGKPIFEDVRWVPQSGQVNGSAENSPSVLLATVRGSYPLAEARNTFAETRAYYRSCEVLEFAQRQLEGYLVSVELPVIDSDPGFTLVARRE